MVSNEEYIKYINYGKYTTLTILYLSVSGNPSIHLLLLSPI